MSKRSVATWCMTMAVVTMTLSAPARADDANPLVPLVDAAAQRLETADPVAATKWWSHDPIEDPQRVQQVLGAVGADAANRGIDPDDVTRIFTDQINATEAIEYTRFAQWKFDPASAPTTAPDLSASRATIDRLNKAMVEQLAIVWPQLHSLDCAGRLDDARNAVIDARGLDQLYQQALSFVTRSYCQS
ncbi:chorismate mutase [Mycobacterium sp. MMS18-G62]